MFGIIESTPMNHMIDLLSVEHHSIAKASDLKRNLFKKIQNR